MSGTGLRANQLSRRAGIGRLESAPVSLAINVRDALPADDMLTARTNPEVAHGNLARSVPQPAKRMAPEVANHAFKPYFTSREIGRAPGWA